ncbi:MAG: acyltransferase [Bacteroidales bacterium]|nr:acyltransferase [Bacteroidales bacterium]
MYSEKDFDEIRPYHDNEINPALVRMTESPVFPAVINYLFPEKTLEYKNLLNGIHTAYDFQIKFMHSVVRKVVEKTSAGLTFDGFDKLNPDTPYLFIANHRDIVLDSAILQILLVENNLPTSEITFGNNLMSSQFIIDFGKCNRMFTVYRGGSKIEIMKNSILLSSYIRYTITEKKNSIWIAQRNGRTKDGCDKTEEAFLKMLTLSSENKSVENLSELNIVPLTISYEYEPCCLLKAKELYYSRDGKYQKKPDEDFTSVLTGITQKKGKIHVSAGKCLNDEIRKFDDSNNYNSNIEKLTLLLDKNIYNNYKLLKTNYIAFDLLNKNSKYCEYYSPQEKENFLNLMNSEINTVETDKDIFKEIYLKIYANPVTNKLNSI